MQKFFTILILSVSILFTQSVQAQDIHFAHLHATPTLLNPSMTGLFNGDLRFNGNYRSQWNGFTNGYSTCAASADMKLAVLENKSAIGGGLILTSDKAGDLDLSTTSIHGSLSFMKALDATGRNFISFGIQNSFTNSHLDYSKIVAFDSEPVIMDGTSRYWDISTGVSYYTGFGRDNMMYIGGGIFHINKPNTSMYKKSGLYPRVDLDRKYLVHGGADIRLSKVTRIKPTFIYMDQGPHKEINVGSFLKYKNNRGLVDKNPFALYVGGWVRWYVEADVAGVDAWITAVRLDYKDLTMTLSFDTNISSLARASYGRGGTEFSVTKIMDWERNKVKKQKLKCPAISYQ